MPNIHQIVDNFASQISNDSTRDVWFTNLDLKKPYSHFSLDNLPLASAVLAW